MILGGVLVAWAAFLASTVAWATWAPGHAGGRTPPHPPQRGDFVPPCPPLGQAGGRTPPAAESGIGDARLVVVRPCAGLEPSLEHTLASSERALQRRPIALRFAVAEASDAAFDAARAVATRLAQAEIDARVVITAARAPNRKAAQIARVLEDEPHADIVVVADSDLELEPETLDALVAPLRADARVAAAWAVPIEVAPMTAADRASAAILDASLHSFALLSVLDPLLMVGKLVALRAATLDATGGFGALTTHLGEDMELARRLRATGARVCTAPARALSLACGRSWGSAILRYARWIHVVRAKRPWLLASYPALFVATPLILFLGPLAATSSPGLASAAVALALVARLAAAAAARARTGGPMRASRLLVDSFLADGLLLAAFATAIVTRRVHWRGAVLHHARGALEEAPR